MMEIGGHPVIIQRKAIKHLYLRIKPPGKVVVSAPRHWPQNAIDSIIHERHDWIVQQQAKLAKRPVDPVTLNSGTNVRYAGKSYALKVEQGTGRNSISLNDNVMTMRLKEPTCQTTRQNTLDRWYRQQLKQSIAQLLADWQPIMQVQASDFGVRKMKTRWGSCNIRTKKIWLSFDLVKTAHDCLEYVVVHELTHLYEKYHNARFYRLMDQFLPDWRERKARLNHHA